jgi:hypothetical protein
VRKRGVPANRDSSSFSRPAEIKKSPDENEERQQSQNEAGTSRRKKPPLLETVDDVFFFGVSAFPSAMDGVGA